MACRETADQAENACVEVGGHALGARAASDCCGVHARACMRAPQCWAPSVCMNNCLSPCPQISYRGDDKAWRVLLPCTPVHFGEAAPAAGEAPNRRPPLRVATPALITELAAAAASNSGAGGAMPGGTVRKQPRLPPAAAAAGASSPLLPPPSAPAAAVPGRSSARQRKPARGGSPATKDSGTAAAADPSADAPPLPGLAAGSAVAARIVGAGGQLTAEDVSGGAPPPDAGLSTAGVLFPEGMEGADLEYSTQVGVG